MAVPELPMITEDQWLRFTSESNGMIALGLKCTGCMTFNPHFIRGSDLFGHDRLIHVNCAQAFATIPKNFLYRSGRFRVSPTRDPIPPTKRFEILRRDKYTCQYCGQSAPDVAIEIDHIVPVSRGGSSNNDNLVAACFDCNRGKQDSVIDPDVMPRLAREAPGEVEISRVLERGSLIACPECVNGSLEISSVYTRLGTGSSFEAKFHPGVSVIGKSTERHSSLVIEFQCAYHHIFEISLDESDGGTFQVRAAIRRTATILH